MYRQSVVGLLCVVAYAAIFFSCSDTPSGPTSDHPVSPLEDSLYDFFPTLAIGDTLSWDYTMTRSTGYVSGVSASGVMTWTVTGRQTVGTTTITQVTQMFNGTAYTRNYGSGVTNEIRGGFSTFTISEDQAHMVTIGVGAQDGEGWFIPPYSRYQRYRSSHLGDSLTFVDSLVSDPAHRMSLKAKQGLGPVQIEFDNLMQYTWTTAHYARRPATAPPDTGTSDTRRWGDFFPLFHVGDTASWDYASQYSSISGPGYAVTGTMKWSVTRVAVGVGGTTTEISQTLNAVLITWSTPSVWVPDTTRITGFTSRATIVEDSAHAVTMRVPIAWIQSVPGYLAEFTYATPRFGFNNRGDDLVVPTTTATAYGTVKLVRDTGPGGLTFGESYLSHNTTTMTRRQNY